MIPIDVPNVFNYTRHEPLGVVVAITPWNSPLMLAAWKLAPALAAGNTVVLKPSEHASASTLEFAHLLEQAGLPPGVLNVVTGFGADIGAALVSHPDVAKITFTGSETSGQRIAAAAAADLKRVTLELGGKSPQIVFDDARLDDAVHGVISGIFLSLGQSCIAGSRLLLQDGIHDRFVERLIAAMRDIRIGDPFDPATQVGPIATGAQHAKVLGFIEQARRDGAQCVLGGKAVRPAQCGAGWYVEPTIFIDVRPEMELFREEVFGPVLAVMRFRDEDEAVRIANDTRYGLAAGVWTQDTARSIRLAERLAAGTVYVNTYRSVSTLSPVGGYKHSGYGRENGIEAIKEFLQVKSVWVGLGPVPNPFPKKPGLAPWSHCGSNVIRGADIIAAIKRSGIATVVALPDIVTSDGVLWPIARDPALRLIRVCKEDEGVSICAGLALTGSSIAAADATYRLARLDQRDSRDRRRVRVRAVHDRRPAGHGARSRTAAIRQVRRAHRRAAARRDGYRSRAT